MLEVAADLAKPAIGVIVGLIVGGIWNARKNACSILHADLIRPLKQTMEDMNIMLTKIQNDIGWMKENQEKVEREIKEKRR